MLLAISALVSFIEVMAATVVMFNSMEIIEKKPILIILPILMIIIAILPLFLAIKITYGY